MSYGELKIDTITFTAGGVDASVSVSGLVQNPTFTGNITTTGTISGDVVRGNTVSGATVTGDAGEFGTITGNTAGFTTVTGTTVTGTTANFVTVSGTTVTGDTGQFTNITGVNIVGTTQVSGATVTGNIGLFTTITGGIHTLTSGVFASGTAANPSITFVDDLDTGIYASGVNAVAISTSGSGRLFVASNGNVGINGTGGGEKLAVYDDNPLRGIVFDVRNTATSAQTGTQVQLTQAGIGNWALGMVPATDAFAIYSGRSQGADGQERLRIDSSGRLGLGTTSPSALLDLNGSISAQTDTLALFNNSYNNYDANGTTAYPVARFQRIGKSGSSFASQADIAIARYENVGSNARTRLDFRLGHVGSSGAPDTTVMSLLSSGRVGIGTTSPARGPLHVHATSGESHLHLTNADTGDTDGDGFSLVSLTSVDNREAWLIQRENAAMRFYVNSDQKMALDTGGRLLIGTTTARSTTGFGQPKLQLVGNYESSILLTNNEGNTNSIGLILSKIRETSIVQNGDALGYITFAGYDGSIDRAGAYVLAQVEGTPGAGDMPTRLMFSTNPGAPATGPTERMRIDSDGFISGYTGGMSITRTVDSAAATGSFINSSATTANQYGLYVRLDGDPNNTSQYFLDCYGSTTQRARIRANGGLANFQSNNVDLSDERTKRDISSVSSTWNCVQAWDVVNYNYLDDAANDTPRIGVIAQQVQQHCPEVVIPYQEAEDAVLDDDGNVVTPAKEERLGVREQQMMWMAIKALQEAQTRIETLEAEVAALKAA